MQGPGRVSSGALATIAPMVPGQRAVPPADLNEEQAEIWRDTVATKPVEWFRADTYPLLAAYCKSITEYRRQSRVLEGLEPGTREYGSLCKLVKDQASLMAALATKMRLTPQSRYTPQSAATASQKTAPSKPWEMRAPKT